jgi:hypothetical protein
MLQESVGVVAIVIKSMLEPFAEIIAGQISMMLQVSAGVKREHTPVK